MTSEAKLTEAERRVLRVLCDGGVDFGCFPFAPIMRRTKLPRAAVRKACRSLKRKGLAEFHIGLWTEDGEMGGAGYCASPAGRSALERTEEERG